MSNENNQIDRDARRRLEPLILHGEETREAISGIVNSTLLSPEDANKLADLGILLRKTYSRLSPAMASSTGLAQEVQAARPGFGLMQRINLAIEAGNVQSLENVAEVANNAGYELKAIRGVKDIVQGDVVVYCNEERNPTSPTPTHKPAHAAVAVAPLGTLIKGQSTGIFLSDHFSYMAASGSYFEPPVHVVHGFTALPKEFGFRVYVLQKRD